MTRGTLARQTEEQLRLTLQELKECKNQNEILLSEREDHEKEMLNIIKRNSDLKIELNKLNINYEELCQKNIQLQNMVDSFDQYRDEYEEALSNTTMWKRKLDEAHTQIKSLETEIHEHKSSQTQNLFQEMFGRDPSIIEKDVTNNKNTLLPIIDLTGDDSIPSYTFQSKNKLKKYIKIIKCIKKTRK
ncbi:uncharacterized protein LOC121736499, partial [Aricia agestis]|uniref:uncharacterized protein LOC121736499 n=1 Tax=Aricia agestis TaxID=91739 RepID=UPI001C207540